MAVFFFLFRRLLLLLPSVRQCLNDGMKVVIPQRAELVLLNALDHKKKKVLSFVLEMISQIYVDVFLKCKTVDALISPETRKTH